MNYFLCLPSISTRRLYSSSVSQRGGQLLSKQDEINFHQHAWFPIWKTFLHLMWVWEFASSGLYGGGWGKNASALRLRKHSEQNHPWWLLPVPAGTQTGTAWPRSGRVQAEKEMTESSLVVVVGSVWWSCPVASGLSAITGQDCKEQHNSVFQNWIVTVSPWVLLYWENKRDVLFACSCWSWCPLFHFTHKYVVTCTIYFMPMDTRWMPLLSLIISSININKPN